ncbi:MAG: hypothetical protein JJ957_13735 [Pseudomonadales bacterium]|nr:hypothetical protein [Pseudomonadales bacterium]MBO6596621.1 hypothetical protein [Pseudomonadales bacterium]MBO6823390.1 hypothetical protein [Pseudomonadales bacterium]
MYATDPSESLVPMFLKSEYDDQFSQFGTGIFVELHGEPFLFTAAHVTDEYEHGKIYVPVIDTFAEVDGYFAFIDLPPEIPREDDYSDVAYFRLSTQFATLLCSNFRPWPQARCRLIDSSLDLGACSIYGYPTSRYKRRGDVHRSESATFRGGAASQDIYDLHGLSTEEHIVVHFHRKRVVDPESGERRNPINPRGVSGGGIYAWPAGEELSNDWTLPLLVGIFHTYNRPQGLMIGTQLLTVLGAIQLGRMKGFGGVL